MPWKAALGISQDLDGRQAGAQAARSALDQLGGSPVQFGFVVISYQQNIQGVLSGVSSLLGNTPLLGMSTSSPLSTGRLQLRLVQVLLFAGQDFKARADWWPGLSDSTRSTTRKMLADLDLGTAKNEFLFLVADGIQGDISLLCSTLGQGSYSLAGVLASGDVLRETTYQLGGASAGSGGLAAACLTGDVQVGIGFGHAWHPVGPNFKITHIRDHIVRTLDDRPVVEVYASLLGGEAGDWLRPPLNRLARIYPLGIEQGSGEDLTILAPLRVEPDGGLRLNLAPPEGRLAFLMASSQELSLEITHQATRQALSDLGHARPLAALVFADLAWEYIFEGKPGALAAAVQHIIGEMVPLAGGYTLGHLMRPSPGVTPKMRQGEIYVIVLGQED